QGDELLEGDALLRGAHEGARRDLALSSVEHLPGFARPLVTLLGVESDRGALTNFLAAMVVGDPPHVLACKHAAATSHLLAHDGPPGECEPVFRRMYCSIPRNEKRRLLGVGRTVNGSLAAFR